MTRELIRTGDDDRDRNSWMRRTAARLAALLIEATEAEATGGQTNREEAGDGDDR